MAGLGTKLVTLADVAKSKDKQIGDVAAQGANVGIDECQWVIDFVRHTGRQLADRGHLLRLQQCERTRAHLIFQLGVGGFQSAMQLVQRRQQQRVALGLEDAGDAAHVLGGLLEQHQLVQVDVRQLHGAPSLRVIPHIQAILWAA